MDIKELYLMHETYNKHVDEGFCKCGKFIGVDAFNSSTYIREVIPFVKYRNKLNLYKLEHVLSINSNDLIEYILFAILMHCNKEEEKQIYKIINQKYGKDFYEDFIERFKRYKNRCALLGLVNNSFRQIH